MKVKYVKIFVEVSKMKIPNLEIICQKVADSYKKVYGDDIQGIYLCGSHANGDFDGDSEIDFAAIVKGERNELQKKRDKVLDETVRMDLEYDVITSPQVISVADFEKYGEEIPAYRHIKRRGKRIDRVNAISVG